MGYPAMTDDDRIEIVAQSLMLGYFGETALLPRWQEFTVSNPDETAAFRTQAREMLGIAKSSAKNVHHSLGWVP